MQERMITKKTNPPFPGLSFCRAASNAARLTAQRYAAALQPNSTSHPFILDQKLLPTTVTTLRQLTEYYFHPRMGHTQGKVITKCCLIYYDSTNGIFFNFFFFKTMLFGNAINAFRLLACIRYTPKRFCTFCSKI